MIFIRSCFFIVILFSLATGEALSAEITVAASANLDPVIGKLVSAFNKSSNVTVKKISGSSGKFVTQIENGAPFDVFMSADMQYPEVLFKEGFAVAPPKIYAYGVLVLWTIKPLDLSRGIDILENSSIEKIALASPRVSPYGREAVHVMKHYEVYLKAEGKLVYGENLSQANTFVMSGAADVGITSKSTVLSDSVGNLAKWVEIPKDSYQAIAQGVVVLSHAKGEAATGAQAFMNFLFTDEAKIIFNESGYTVHE